MDSPRGRIYQIVQVDAGRLALSDSFVTHIDRCLGCLNCQTACPSGVAYGSLLERARAQIAENYQRPWLAHQAAQAFLRGQCFHRSRPSLVMRGSCGSISARDYRTLARATGLLKLLGMAELDALSPRIDSKFSFSDLGKVFPAEGERRGRVAMLIGCVASVAFAESESRHDSRADEERHRGACSGEAILLRRAAIARRSARSGA